MVKGLQIQLWATNSPGLKYSNLINNPIILMGRHSQTQHLIYQVKSTASSCCLSKMVPSIIMDFFIRLLLLLCIFELCQSEKMNFCGFPLGAVRKELLNPGKFQNYNRNAYDCITFLKINLLKTLRYISRLSLDNNVICSAHTC